MTSAAAKDATVAPTIRHGMSWADQQDSPGWTAKSPPKFAEEMPDIVLDEQEYDRYAPKPAGVRAQISVFVGGLDYALESKDIEEFFASNGCKVSRVRVQKSNGKSSGKAFMNVSDAEALAAVLKLSGQTLAGRAISIKEDAGPAPRRAAPSGGRWREEGASSWGEPKRDSRWQSVGKGGKSVDHQPPAWTKPHREQPEPVGERKKLELLPRSKPIDSVVSTSGIFGGAKPRDAFAHKDEQKETKKEPKQAKEPKEPKELKEPKEPREPKKEKKVAAIILAPIPVVKKKVSSNRFVVSSDSDE